MILKMNQDTHGDCLKYQESPGMTFDTKRLHKTWFEEDDSHKNLKILTESWRIAPISGQIQKRVDIVGIYDKNHYSWIRELLIWIQSDF